jgi:hypothetical protein
VSFSPTPKVMDREVKAVYQERREARSVCGGVYLCICVPLVVSIMRRFVSFVMAS